MPGRIHGVGRIVALLLATIALPAVSWAAVRAVSGQQSLRIKVSVSPARAGKLEKSSHLLVIYKRPKSGQQPPYNTHKLIFREAPGLRLRPSAVPQCKESAVMAAKGNATVCPPSSKVGFGTAVINARPTIPKLITATVTAYNAVDDKGYGGFPKGSGEVILYFKTSINVNASYYLHIVKGGAGRTELVGVSTKPSKPGVAPGNSTIQRLDLTLTGWGKKPYLRNPPTCVHSWPFSLTVTNYFGQPSVTARYRVKCTS